MITRAPFFLVGLGFLVLTLATAPPAPAQDDPAFTRAEQGAVRVAVIIDTWQGRFLHSTGSGFVVAPNVVATNAHVVAPALDYNNMSVAIIAPGGRGPQVAQIIRYSANTDLALLRFTGASPEALAISNVEPRPGDAIVALGYPDVDDLQRPAIELVRPTAPSRSSGEIASLRDNAPTGEPIPTINHEAAISSGSSGGPLLDECGRVVGVNTWHARGAQTFQGRGVATRTEQLLDFLRAAGVRPQVLAERCLSAVERLTAERDSAVTDLAGQNREIAEKLAEAQRLAQLTQMMLIGGGVLFLLALGVLALALFMRRAPAATAPAQAPGAAPRATAPSPPTNSGAPYVDPFSSAGPRRPLVRNWPLTLSIAAGVLAAALVIPFALQVMTTRPGLNHTGAAAQFAGVQDCTRADAPDEAPDMSFTIDANACVNNRTPYAPNGDGQTYRFVSLNEQSGALSVLTLTPRNGALRRDLYTLDADALAQAAEASRAAPALNRCVFGEAARGQAMRRNEALMRFARGEPAQRTEWRCRRRP